MCGIFGIISKNQVVYQQFFELGTLNTRRGNLSFGYLTGKMAQENTLDNLHLFRHIQPFQESLVVEENSNLILAHIRAPTTTQSTQLADVHPFETPDGYLAHNGLLLNHTDYSQWYEGYTVDSQIIIGGIQSHLNQGMEIVNAIQKTAAALEGQQACWYWDKPKQHLYFWRVMSPLYVSDSEGTLYFSSIQHELASSLLKEGVIYHYNLSLSCLTEVGEFEFQSPYLY